MRPAPRSTSHAGFTLIELSIVLVIIGLIVGGVLAGRDMIEAAAIRAQVSQFEKIAAAANMFKTKYNLLPGDAMFNNNGVIDDFTAKMVDDGVGLREQAYEPMFFLSQLVKENWIPSTFICPPSDYWGYPNGNYAMTLNPAASIIGVTHAASSWLFIGQVFSGGSCNANYMWSNQAGVVTPLQAYAMDQKMDDGIPGTGGFYATMMVASYLQSVPDTTVSSCVVDATAKAYNVSNTAKACQLMVKLQ